MAAATWKGSQLLQNITIIKTTHHLQIPKQLYRYHNHKQRQYSDNEGWLEII